MRVRRVKPKLGDCYGFLYSGLGGLGTFLLLEIYTYIKRVAKGPNLPNPTIQWSPA